MLEDISLKVTSENKHRRCGCDMLGQTVPSTVCSNREGPITATRLATGTAITSYYFNKRQ